MKGRFESQMGVVEQKVENKKKKATRKAKTETIKPDKNRKEKKDSQYEAKTTSHEEFSFNIGNPAALLKRLNKVKKEGIPAKTSAPDEHNVQMDVREKIARFESQQRNEMESSTPTGSNAALVVTAGAASKNTPAAEANVADIKKSKLKRKNAQKQIKKTNTTDHLTSNTTTPTSSPDEVMFKKEHSVDSAVGTTAKSGVRSTLSSSSITSSGQNSSVSSSSSFTPEEIKKSQAEYQLDGKGKLQQGTKRGVSKLEGFEEDLGHSPRLKENTKESVRQLPSEFKTMKEQYKQNCLELGLNGPSAATLTSGEKIEKIIESLLLIGSMDEMTARKKRNYTYDMMVELQKFKDLLADESRFTKTDKAYLQDMILIGMDHQGQKMGRHEFKMLKLFYQAVSIAPTSYVFRNIVLGIQAESRLNKATKSKNVDRVVAQQKMLQLRSKLLNQEVRKFNTSYRSVVDELEVLNTVVHKKKDAEKKLKSMNKKNKKPIAPLNNLYVHLSDALNCCDKNISVIYPQLHQNGLYSPSTQENKEQKFQEVYYACEDIILLSAEMLNSEDLDQTKQEMLNKMIAYYVEVQMKALEQSTRLQMELKAEREVERLAADIVKHVDFNHIAYLVLNKRPNNISKALFQKQLLELYVKEMKHRPNAEVIYCGGKNEPVYLIRDPDSKAEVAIRPREMFKHEERIGRSPEQIRVKKVCSLSKRKAITRQYYLVPGAYQESCPIYNSAYKTTEQVRIDHEITTAVANSKDLLEVFVQLHAAKTKAQAENRSVALLRFQLELLKLFKTLPREVVQVARGDNACMADLKPANVLCNPEFQISDNKGLCIPDYRLEGEQTVGFVYKTPGFTTQNAIGNITIENEKMLVNDLSVVRREALANTLLQCVTLTDLRGANSDDPYSLFTHLLDEASSPCEYEQQVSETVDGKVQAKEVVKTDAISIKEMCSGILGEEIKTALVWLEKMARGQLSLVVIAKYFDQTEVRDKMEKVAGYLKNQSAQQSDKAAVHLVR